MAPIFEGDAGTTTKAGANALATRPPAPASLGTTARRQPNKGPYRDRLMLSATGGGGTPDVSALTGRAAFDFGRQQAADKVMRRTPSSVGVESYEQAGPPMPLDLEYKPYSPPPAGQLGAPALSTQPAPRQVPATADATTPAPTQTATPDPPLQPAPEDTVNVTPGTPPAPGAPPAEATATPPPAGTAADQAALTLGNVAGQLGAEEPLTFGNVADQLGTEPTLTEFPARPTGEKPPGAVPEGAIDIGGGRLAFESPDAMLAAEATEEFKSGLPKAWSDPANPNRFSAKALEYFEKNNIHGDDRYAFGTALGAGVDVSKHIDPATGKPDPISLKQDLRATSPEFVANEFNEFMNTPEAKQAELQLDRYINAMSRGGASFQGRPRINAAAEYNKFRENMMETYTKNQQRQDNLYIQRLADQGKITQQEATARLAATNNAANMNLQKLKGEQAGEARTAAATEAEKTRGFKTTEREATQEFKREIADLGYEKQEERDLAGFMFKRGMKAADIRADREARKDVAKSSLANTQAQRKGKTDKELAAMKTVEKNKAVSNWADAIRKETGGSPDKAELDEVRRQFSMDWETSALQAEYPGISNIVQLTEGGRTVVYGTTPKGKRVLREVI